MKKEVQINFLTLILVIVIVAIITGGIIFTIQYFINKPDNKIENMPVTNNNNLQQEVYNKVAQEEISKKIDNSKEWVYKAEYKNNLATTEYELLIEEGKTKKYIVGDIVVPYININSQDAQKVNEEIKNIYSEQVKKFEKELQEPIKSSYYISNYETYVNDNILSVLITVEQGGTDIPQFTYYAYNFNLDTLNLLTYKDVYTKAGFGENNIVEKVNNSIKDNKMYKEEDFNILEEDEKNDYINKSLEEYKKLAENNKIQYYLNSNGKLNIITTLYYPAGRGMFNKIIEIAE